MPKRLFRAGDRVRLLVPTESGWIGVGTVVRDQEPGDYIVDFLKDGPVDADERVGFAMAMDLELVGE